MIHTTSQTHTTLSTKISKNSQLHFLTWCPSLCLSLNSKPGHN